jgi:hypothetical protein
LTEWTSPDLPIGIAFARTLARDRDAPDSG